ncbi:MAG: hypothetical protein L0228_12710 [Planctomycetes bacterium]|nr:hypothetical protein [Planctomycetota bacterium]
MFFPLDEFASVLAPESVSCLVIAGSAMRTYAVVLLFAFVAVFAAAPRASAQQLWSADDSSGILFVSDAGTETRWFELPRVQLLAFRDEWYAPSHVLAQSQPAGPAAPSEEPLILPPQAGTMTAPTADVDAANPDQTEEIPGIVAQVPAAEPEKKEEDKPAIPDLAKGILIASNDGDLTFKPGLRIQPRYMYESGNDNHDFFIRRFRLKGGGSAYDVAKYGVELKIDNDGRFAATPSARVENAWLDFPVHTDLMYLRAGLYDVPFSRDALTSDSKLLFMDRTLIKEEVTGVGMADNGIGLMLHGRPYSGYLEYAVGIFDNVTFERFGVAGTRESDKLMPVGRVVVSLLDPMTPLDGYADYQESYIGKGQRLEIGANAAHLSEVIDGAALFDLSAWGVDLFANSGHYTFQTEYDQIIENISGAADIIADGWYVQAGYLFDVCDPCTEFAVRYQELDPIVGNDTLRWTSIGFNFYIREHNLKIQTDYTFRSDTVGVPLPGGLGLFDEDVFEVQLQLDF